MNANLDKTVYEQYGQIIWISGILIGRKTRVNNKYAHFVVLCYILFTIKLV